jgi:CDP-diglyceride synthetase
MMRILRWVGLIVGAISALLGLVIVWFGYDTYQKYGTGINSFQSLQGTEWERTVYFQQDYTGIIITATACIALGLVLIIGLMPIGGKPHGEKH